MVNYRKLPFENVVKNLKEGKYRGKIISADYANLGIQPFKIRKFAEQLGVSSYWLQKIGLIKITEQCGWNLPKEPTVDKLQSYKEVILKQRGEF